MTYQPEYTTQQDITPRKLAEMYMEAQSPTGKTQGYKDATNVVLDKLRTAIGKAKNQM